MAELLQAFGLSSPAGLNAYLALLIAGLAARVGMITFAEPYQYYLTNVWVLGVLAILLAIEILVDKIPAVDHLNDSLSTFIRPVAGAILFAAADPQIVAGMHPVFSLLLGLVAAGSFHAMKVATRPVVNVTTGGVATPLVSLAEDIFAGTTVFLAIAMPVLAIIFLVLMLVLWAVTFLALRRLWQSLRST